MKYRRLTVVARRRISKKQQTLPVRAYTGQYKRPVRHVKIGGRCSSLGALTHIHRVARPDTPPEIADHRRKALFPNQQL